MFNSIRLAVLLGTATAAALGVTAAPRQAPAAGVAPLPNFACYEAKFSAVRHPSLRIVDELGKRTTTLGAAVSFCASASVDRRPAAEPGQHVVCHSLGERKSLVATLRLVNELGQTRATLTGEHTLCVPASVTTGGSLPPPPALDVFMCYAARPGQSSARSILVADRFGRSGDELGTVTSVCAPASLDGSRVLQRRLFACYRLTSSMRSRPAIVRSRLALLKSSSGLRRQLCVPSTRVG